MKILLGNLLKWQYQPTPRSSAWRGSILEQRLRIRDLLQDSPSLLPYLAEAVDRAYEDGSRLASKEPVYCWSNSQRDNPTQWITCSMMIDCQRIADHGLSPPSMEPIGTKTVQRVLNGLKTNQHAYDPVISLGPSANHGP